MSYSNSGFHKEVLSFPVQEEIALGRVVTVANGNAVKATAEKDFIGVLDTVRAGIAGVQMEGYVECRYSGTAPIVGVGGLVADANGYVKASDAAQRKYRILQVNTSKHTVGFLL